MSRTPGRFARPAWALAVPTALLLALAACDEGSSHPSPAAPEVAGCTAPARGSRYAVCGHLSTGTSATGAVHTVAGSVDASTDATASHHSILGGTFHADR